MQAVVRSVWVSSLNVIGGKKQEQSADALGNSQVNLNVAKIVISRMHLSKDAKSILPDSY